MTNQLMELYCTQVCRDLLRKRELAKDDDDDDDKLEVSGVPYSKKRLKE